MFKKISKIEIWPVRKDLERKENSLLACEHYRNNLLLEISFFFEEQQHSNLSTLIVFV